MFYPIMRALPFAAVLSLGLLTGCAVNGFEKYYTEHAPKGEPTQEVVSYSVDTPEDVFNTFLRLSEKNYQVIGESNFYWTSNQCALSEAVDWGKEIGAEVLIYRYKDKGTTYSSAPSFATSYGPGFLPVYTMGTQLIVEQNAECSAVFLKKAPSWKGFGIATYPTPRNTLKKIGTNKGLAIVVYDGSPAYEEDFMTGDILLSINGKPVEGSIDLRRAITERSGRKNILKLWRDGKIVTKTTKFPEKTIGE